ncbi:MAG: hypothetical protein RH917_20335 [Lacipirellulaceae bacterium]
MAVALKGDDAPGTATGVEFREIQRYILNNQGQVAFEADLMGTDVTSSSQRGIWSQENGSELKLVARADSIAPGTGDAEKFFSFINIRFNDAGETAILGQLATQSTHNVGLWSDRNGSDLALVARAGSPAPDVETGVTFGAGFNFGGSVFSFNDNGNSSFLGALEGPGIDSTNNIGIWSEEGTNGLKLVSRKSQPLDTYVPTIASNNNDQVAFIFQAFMPRTQFVGDSSGVTNITTTGDAAPGTGDSFLGFPFPTVINGRNEIAFLNSTTGTGNPQGVWSGGEDGLRLVALSGKQAPGTNEGVVFAGFEGVAAGLDTFFAPAFNGNGQTAIMAALSGNGVDGSNDIGIWAEDPSGDLQLVAREGDTIDVNDGPGVDLRTVFSLNFVRETGNEDGKASGFNDLGQLVFHASFTDGSQGIFVSNQAAIPQSYGDFDADGNVGGSDFLAWQRDDATAAGLAAWQNNYGITNQSLSATQSVPEPNSICFATSLILLLLARSQTKNRT